MGVGMKWRKLGKLFDPTEHKLPNRCVEFAQSPQTLLLADRLRVYFSTRERDSAGKYLSHVAYADFSRDLSQFLGVSDHTVLPLGGLGSFAGAVAGGLLLGLVEGLGAGFLSSAYKDAIAFVVILAVLFFLPGGLLGARDHERV